MHMGLGAPRSAGTAKARVERGGDPWLETASLPGSAKSMYPEWEVSEHELLALAPQWPLVGERGLRLALATVLPNPRLLFLARRAA